MIGFHDIAWPDVALSIASIESIGPTQKPSAGESYRELRMRKGDPRRVHPNEVDRLLLRAVQLLPAEPGITVLRVWVEDGKGELIRTPVIAWALCLDGDVRPVTPQGINDGAGRNADVYVAMPDGSVQSVGQFCDIVAYENVDAFLSDQTERQLRRGTSADHETL